MGRRQLGLLFAIATFVAGAASADVASEARFFDGLGRRAYTAGRYAQALEAFQLVQEIAPSDAVLYNIALCADLAGRADMAFSLFQEYLRGTDLDPARRSEAERRFKGLQSKLALLEVKSNPAGAVLHVDRKELGRFGVTPSVIPVDAGERQVLIELPGFVPRTVPVTARLGELQRVEVTLEPLIGELSVQLIPASAKLSVLRDGRPISVHLERGRARLPVGTYRVTASLPGYLAATTQVRVRQAEVARVNLGLVPVPSATGRLLVSTGNVVADVFVDGKRVAVAPATLPEVQVGAHTIEVRAGSRVAKRKVTIQKGRASYLEIDLGTGAP